MELWNQKNRYPFKQLKHHADRTAEAFVQPTLEVTRLSYKTICFHRLLEIQF
ncbi:MAG: hypothetical protein KME27_30035 [Lyngbya sp. HA4199-MV5]|jgi:hypothetical protein|nr:hypothetical protein [Lyngbya sp. HA4199-MV5]